MYLSPKEVLNKEIKAKRFAEADEAQKYLEDFTNNYQVKIANK